MQHRLRLAFSEHFRQRYPITKLGNRNASAFLIHLPYGFSRKKVVPVWEFLFLPFSLPKPSISDIAFSRKFHLSFVAPICVGGVMFCLIARAFKMLHVRLDHLFFIKFSAPIRFWVFDLLLSSTRALLICSFSIYDVIHATSNWAWIKFKAYKQNAYDSVIHALKT